MATREAKISDDLQDEIWMIMHMVAELEVHSKDTLFDIQPRPSFPINSCKVKTDDIQPRPSFPINSCKVKTVKKWQHECDEDVADGVIEVDSPTEHDLKEEAFQDAAEKLKKAGDAYDEQQKLVHDIVLYIRDKGKEIQDEYDGQLNKMRPSDLFFQSGVFSSVYGYFKSQLQTIIGDGEDFTKFALVSNVTIGVTRSLKDSSFDYAHLTASLASKFIIDKYGRFVVQKGGMAKLVLDQQEEMAAFPVRHR